MKKFFTVPVVFLNLITLQLSVTSLGNTETAIIGLKASFAEVGQQVLTYTNQFRAQNSLPALIWNQTLADLATEHSKNMAEGKVPFGHAGFAQRVARFPFPARGAAENVYMIQTSSTTVDIAKRAVDAWIGSSGHRRNLLGNYKYCGVGVWRNAQGRWYVTQLFGLW